MIRSSGSDFCWFGKLDRVNTLKMPSDIWIRNFEKRMEIEHDIFSSTTLLEDERP